MAPFLPKNKISLKPMKNKKIYKYGYDINAVSRKIYKPKRIKTGWGYFSKLSQEKKYDLQQIFLKKRGKFTLKHCLNKEKLIYLESGQVSIKQHNLKPQETLFVPGGVVFKPLDIISKEDSFIYIFSGLTKKSSNNLKKSKTFDRRYKYWAENLIETIIDRGFTGKKIFFKKGNSSSLHFHCRKTETYFIHSGKLFLRLKAGQGEDKFFILRPGQAINITPGLMHQAGGLEDTIIIEISTPDQDADSFIVESEFSEMPRMKENLKIQIPQRVKNVLFDMDDVLVRTRIPDKVVKETIFASLNLRWSQIIQYNHLAMKELFPKIFKEFNIKGSPRGYADFYFRAYNKLLADTAKENIVPGVVELIKKLSKKNYRLALVTSSTFGQAKIICQALHLEDLFEVTITANDITHSKPHPEPYQKAVDKLGVKPEECAVIENFPTGVASAKAVSKNVFVIAITTTNLKKELKEADFVIDSFNQIEV